MIAAWRACVACTALTSLIEGCIDHLKSDNLSGLQDTSEMQRAELEFCPLCCSPHMQIRQPSSPLQKNSSEYGVTVGTSWFDCRVEKHGLLHAEQQERVCTD